MQTALSSSGAAKKKDCQCDWLCMRLIWAGVISTPTLYAMVCAYMEGRLIVMAQCMWAKLLP